MKGFLSALSALIGIFLAYNCRLGLLFFMTLTNYLLLLEHDINRRIGSQ